MPRLLMVDDDQHYCALIGNLLTGKFDIVFAHTLNDGIEAIRERQPDGVLLDLKMPDSDANPLKTLARLKQHRTTAAIMVLTRNTDRDLHRQLIRDTASACFIKDVDDRDVDWLVSQILSAITCQDLTGPMSKWLNQLKSE